MNPGTVQQIAVTPSSTFWQTTSDDRLVTDTFTLPSSTFSGQMAGYTASAYQIRPCSPSTGTSNVGCIGGTSEYNLNIRSPSSASSVR